MINNIEIDSSAGFCFGVEKAIEKAESYLKDGQILYGLGSMVHNKEELERLATLGLKTITLDGLPEINNGKLIFRAHGEPPATYELASKYNIEVIDATCPIVMHLQQKIKKKYLELDKEKEQIVIFGKKDHPESVGLMGQTNDEAVLISDADELDNIDPAKHIFLYSQTTMDPGQFDLLVENIKRISSVSGDNSLQSTCSICKQMKRRKPNIKLFAQKHDLVIFVSGKKSANGKMLFDYCKSINKNSFMIQNPQDINPEWIKDNSSIGISGATSTSVWQLEQVKASLLSLTRG